MTYCVGLKLNQGLVFMSDTLTNAGIDNVNTNKKMFFWSNKNERSVVLLTSGNLATSQATINLINEAIDNPNNDNDNILKTKSMFQVARIIGKILRNISNGISPDDRYVEIAKGLDYNDVVPVKGIINGYFIENQNLELSIDILNQ